MDGVCKKCPADTDIALGGPLAKSICAKCPKGSYVNAEGDECMCPAGHYMTAADQPLGFVRIACKPCIARAAYMAEDGHTFESCSLCRAPLVANKDHTGCGELGVRGRGQLKQQEKSCKVLCYYQAV